MEQGMVEILYHYTVTVSHSFSNSVIAVVYIINKQTSKDPTIMILVRRLVLPILKFNILFKVSHIAGIKNIAADQLSRLQIQQFKRECPHMDSATTIVVPDMQTL